MAAEALNNWFQQDASRLVDRIYEIFRSKGRVSNLIPKGPMQDGIGFNYNSVLYKRSNPSGGDGWVAVSQPNGTNNICVPAPGTTNPASTLQPFVAYQRLEFTQDICFEAARRAYDFKQQVAAIRENFAQVIVDIWEDQDKAQFIANAGHTISFTGTTPAESTTPGLIPLATPNSVLTQSLLNSLYQRICNDGGGEEPYAMSEGAPVIPMILSMDQSQNIIQRNADVRQDFRFAQMGDGKDADLMKSWAIDKSYGGFLHIIDFKMPRWAFTAGAWVQIPYYSNQGTTIGQEAIVNPAYTNAMYESVFLWSKNGYKRLMPKPLGSVGADTSGVAVNWAGEVTWQNIRNKELNPLGNIGFYSAALQAAYEPIKTQYMYHIVVLRCPNVGIQGCY